MRRREQGAWFSLGCGLAGGLLVLATFIPVRTTTPAAAPASAPAVMVDVVEPARSARELPSISPPARELPVQRPSNMVVPEEEPVAPLPFVGIELRSSFWDPDSAVAPSLQPAGPAAPRWNPDTAVAPYGAPRPTGPVAVWDPDSAVPPS
jgi:hypothetical protein